MLLNETVFNFKTNEIEVGTKPLLQTGMVQVHSMMSLIQQNRVQCEYTNVRTLALWDTVKYVSSWRDPTQNVLDTRT